MGLAAKSAEHMTIVVDATHLKAYRATSRPIGKKKCARSPGSRVSLTMDDIWWQRQESCARNLLEMLIFEGSF